MLLNPIHWDKFSPMLPLLYQSDAADPTLNILGRMVENNDLETTTRR